MSSRTIQPGVGSRGPHAVVKFGGGLITTELDGHPVTDRELVVARARELVATRQSFVLVHGTGTFGKPPAIRFGYMEGRLPRHRNEVVATVSTMLARLELDVLECLAQAGMRPLRLPAWVLYPAHSSGPDSHALTCIGSALEHGMTPVIGGNFILDEDGFSVCSSDVIATQLALALGAPQLVMATRAHGVYRAFGDGDEIHDCLDMECFDHAVTEDPLDVSGGMHAKLKSAFQAAAAGIHTYVIDGRVAGNLAATLASRPLSGTRLAGRLDPQPVAG